MTMMLPNNTVRPHSHAVKNTTKTFRAERPIFVLSRGDVMRKIVRWSLAVFLFLLGLFMLVLSPMLLVGWTAEPVALSPGRVKLLVTLGLVCIGLAPICFAGAGLVIGFFRWSQKKPPVL